MVSRSPDDPYQTCFSNYWSQIVTPSAQKNSTTTKIDLYLDSYGTPKAEACFSADSYITLVCMQGWVPHHDMIYEGKNDTALSSYQMTTWWIAPRNASRCRIISSHLRVDVHQAMSGSRMSTEGFGMHRSQFVIASWWIRTASFLHEPSTLKRNM